LSVPKKCASLFIAVAATVRPYIHGGVLMQRRIFAGLFLFYLFTVAGGGAQSLADREKPVWTMEILKVLPGEFGPTLGYLDDNWMRIREEAKRQGAVLSYHRIAEQSTSESDPNIVLLTEYKNQDAYDSRGKLFASIFKQFPRNFPGELLFYQHKDLYETVSTQVFEDYQDTHIAEFRLVTEN
jgi:hypothetical protein